MFPFFEVRLCSVEARHTAHLVMRTACDAPGRSHQGVPLRTATHQGRGPQPTATGMRSHGIFQKHSPREKVLLDGNFDKIWTGLRSHTALKHLFSVHPYLRPLKKLARTIEENWATRKYESGREILDSFYEQQKGLGL